MQLSDIQPTEKRLLMHLVEEAGFDISDWSNYAKGASAAAANPKYCYRWHFVENDKFLFTLWFDGLAMEDGAIVKRGNFRSRSDDEKGPVRSRSLKTDQAIANAYSRRVDFRVITLGRAGAKSHQRVDRRLLDEVNWHVAEYEYDTGDFCLKRGPGSTPDDDPTDQELLSFIEGQKRQSFRTHRRRETALRDMKIRESLASNGGRLICEVASCRFDFKERYGAIGEGYAQVHHLLPLSTAPDEGFEMKSDMLAIVCANCHAMIHLGGECRSLECVSGMIASAILEPTS